MQTVRGVQWTDGTKYEQQNLNYKLPVTENVVIKYLLKRLLLIYVLCKIYYVVNLFSKWTPAQILTQVVYVNIIGQFLAMHRLK